MDSKLKFQKFEELGSKALEILRQKSFLPNDSKKLRFWNLTEVSELTHKTTQTIRENERKGILKKPETNKGLGKRYYALEDINKIRSHFKNLPRKPNNVQPIIIAFANLKGGVAKTTSAVHASHYFALNGYRTLLIDVDSQGSATSAFGYAPDEHIKKEQTLYKFFTGAANSIRDSIIKTHWDGLDLIPANLTLYGVELELPALRERSLIQNGYDFKIYNILSNGLQEVYQDYDIVIIDCPPSMSILNTNALYAANGLIIPCPPELPDIASMIQFFGMIKSTLNFLPEKEFDFIRVLITKHDGSKSSEAISDILRQLYGNHIMRAEMLNTHVIKRARTETNSIYELSSYKGSRQTLSRAKIIVDQVNKEIEHHVQEIWQTWLSVTSQQNELETTRQNI